MPPGQLFLATGFAATRDRALSPELARFRNLHFATHGVLDSRRPELSKLVLSLYDEQGRPQDGFLPLNDIYNLRLNADLVVLSACRTALGQEIRGEGLVGLTRGFMYAGAARVLASLWSVEDRATAELMGELYRGMLRQRLSPAAALRQAQLAMRQSPAAGPPSTGPASPCKGSGGEPARGPRTPRGRADRRGVRRPPRAARSGSRPRGGEVRDDPPQADPPVRVARLHEPEDLADETINRVARRLAEGIELRSNDPYGYFCGVATWSTRKSCAAPPASTGRSRARGGRRRPSRRRRSPPTAASKGCAAASTGCRPTSAT